MHKIDADGEMINPTPIEDKLNLDRNVWIEPSTNLPFEFNKDIGRLVYLTPCCLSYASVFTDSGETYCKKCYETVSPLCGGGPRDRFCRGCGAALDEHGLANFHGHTDNCPEQ